MSKSYVLVLSDKDAAKFDKILKDEEFNTASEWVAKTVKDYDS